MADASKARWYRLTPDRLIIGLLAAAGLLWLSERFQWFAFNQHKGWTVLIAVASVGMAFLLMLPWFLTSLLFRWQFQLSIRSLLVMVVAVALPFSWLAVEMKKVREQREALEEITKIGGLVAWDNWQRTPHSQVVEWLQSVVGDDFFANPTQVYLTDTRATDVDLRCLRGLPTLKYLTLSGGEFTDAGLVNLRGLTALQGLGLTGWRVTNAGLANLKGLTDLRGLTLYVQVKDSGLENLRGMTALQSLSLCRTQVTDAGLKSLRGLTALKWLSLEGTKVTDAGVKKLQQALPNCKIVH